MLSIGSLISGTEDRSGLNNHYYITDRAFTIKQGGIINVEYGVKQNDSYLSGGLNPVTVEFAGASTDGIEYGYLPQISDLRTRTLSAWIWLDADPPGNSNFIMGAFMKDISGYVMSVHAGRKLQFYQCHTGAGNVFGIWNTPLNSVPTGAWVHVVVTHDNTNPVVPPSIYIDSVYQAFTVVSYPAGAIAPEMGSNFVVGNVNSSTFEWNHPFDGKIFDPRVYNRILSAAEVTTLYNAGTPDHTLVTSGLVFQGMAVYADKGDAASLAGTVLSSTDKLTENILRAVGTPNGSPTIRANP